MSRFELLLGFAILMFLTDVALVAKSVAALVYTAYRKSRKTKELPQSEKTIASKKGAVVPAKKEASPLKKVTKTLSEKMQTMTVTKKTDIKSRKEPIKSTIFNRLGALLLRTHSKMLLFVIIPQLLYLTAFFVTFFCTRPHVTATSPGQSSIYADLDQPMIVMFDKPVDVSKVLIKVLPEEFYVKKRDIHVFDGFSQWLSEKTGLSLEIPLVVGYEMLPIRTFHYEQKIVFYFTGLQSMTGAGGVHEYAYDLQTPKKPQVVSTSIADSQKDVLPNVPITVAFDSVVTDAMKVVAETIPEMEYEVVKASSNELAITYKEPLKQGTEYKVTVYTVKQVMDLVTNTVISAEDPELLGVLHFKTVTPPGIKSISPQGNSAKSTDIIQIEFTEPVIKDTVEGNITIDPETKGTYSWESSEKIVFKPEETLQKGSWYTVTIKKGIKTLKGGESIEDIVHKFETLGVVKVTGFSPWNGGRSVSVSSPLRIDFNQEVDHGSAASKVSVSPALNASTWWDGNTYVIDQKGNLAYGTKYSVQINPGVRSIYGLDSTETYSYSFTTQPETVTINVPRYTQGAGTFVCNIVSARMALAYRGVYISNDQLINAIGRGEPYNSSTLTGGNPNQLWIDHYGIHWDPLARGIRNWRGAEVKSGMSLSALAAEIRNGNPVVIFWYNGVSSQTLNSWYNQYGAKPGLHSVTVYGYKGPESSPTHILVKDPWFSKELYTAGEFNAKWSYFGKKAVVVK